MGTEQGHHPGSGAAARRDARIAAGIEAWFAREARDLPWRRALPGGGRDPYRSLVSEIMLQQTQVARVLERWDAFIDRFPTVEALAAASEDDVLAAWSGLGYYRRARRLQEAARAIVEDHAGRAPADVASLRALPGVGQYTAGAVASLAFGAREPIVDGNIRRVLVRLDGRDLEETERRTEAWAWSRAEELVGVAGEPAVFNEGLMELGALVCTPSSPSCARCPVSSACEAARRGIADRIPPKRRSPPRQTVWHASVVVRDARGRVLVEQRGGDGLWASMWQAPTVEGARSPGAAAVRRRVGLDSIEERERFDHATTHRLVRFVVYEGRLARGARPRVGEWRTRRAAAELALSSPQRRILLGG